MIPIEDLTDVTLAIEDTDEDDEGYEGDEDDEDNEVDKGYLVIVIKLHQEIKVFQW